MPDETKAPAKPRGAPKSPSQVDDLVESWWHDHFPGSPVAAVTGAWNHAFAAKDELKKRLREAFEASGS